MYIPDEKRYESIPYRRTGKSGLMLPAISLGLWHNFGEIDDYKTARNMIHRSFDMGITHFDLANNYGPPPGSAETVFGKMLKDGLGTYRDELIISTKAGWRMWPGPYGDLGSRKYLISSLDQSLRRMGIEYVDIFYHHRRDPDTPLEESLGALDHIVRSGKALYVGISSYDAASTRQAAQMLREMGTPCLIHQPVYNMFNRSIEAELIDALRDTGMGCIPFSPLAQGMLSDKYLKGIPKGSRADKPHGFLQKDAITENRLRQIKALNEVATRRGQSLAQMAIAWVLRIPEVTSVLIGASSVEQIEENLASLKNLHFTNEEYAQIDQILHEG
ncbi:MAG: aldo/keto reductase family protein [Bacteroidetes bacterium HLUCCA01]|nr:MAG: aldo/keto reductase family protein [Bacteroidetes bacterium HLUCCA01]